MRIYIVGNVVDYWLQNEFRRRSRAKCLILIGPSGTGKTSFARSIACPFNYFNGKWRISDYNQFASYSIYDNIGWDQFEEKGFPDKKSILTQSGLLYVSYLLLFPFCFFVS